MANFQRMVMLFGLLVGTAFGAQRQPTRACCGHC